MTLYLVGIGFPEAENIDVHESKTFHGVLYHFKNYAEASRGLRQITQQYKPNTRTLLGMAYGDWKASAMVATSLKEHLVICRHGPATEIATHDHSSYAPRALQSHIHRRMRR
ncbi:MAG: hypothetical protein DME76_13350 [Verrucomicrobia bacterium]|nr:MAG: hypothetical protein DME76_13350 [Verrucomicrobiota bacterium]